MYVHVRVIEYQWHVHVYTIKYVNLMKLIECVQSKQSLKPNTDVFVVMYF